ncbi:hypothetical protein FRC01_004473 [Tulasnella sp. 417]|nr:hypothetical protein FRC01_004473 [Tulasnella sp. 417]
MDDLKFEGKGGKEAEDFVAAVKKIALKEGKHQDSEWTAAFASTCFYGPALRWFEELDENVQSDWKLLRRAILQKWPAEARAGGSASGSLPTFAAAPPPAAAGPSAPTLATPAKSLSYRPVDEEFCGTQCQDRASRAAPLLIKLEAADSMYKEVNALFGVGWQHSEKACPSVKRIFRIIMKPTLMEYYYAYRWA